MDRYSNFASRFGQNVKKKRLAKRLTQDDVVQHLKKDNIKVSQSYISLLEAGQRTDPSLKLVVALATMFNISIDDIIKESGVNNGF